MRESEVTNLGMVGVTTAAPTKAASPQQYPHTPEDLRKEPNYPIWVRLRASRRSRHRPSPRCSISWKR